MNAGKTRRRAALLLLAAATALAVGLAEIAVRLVAPRWILTGMTFFEADPEIGWKPAPNVRTELSNHLEFETEVRTDELGLRIGTAAHPPAPALLGVGDSFLFGFGVEADEAFLALAAGELGLRPANAGGPSWGPCQATARARRLLDRVEPRTVLLSIFLGNDEVDAARGTQFLEVRDGALVQPGWKPSPLRPLLHPLLEHSHLVRLVRYSPLVTGALRRVRGTPDLYREALLENLAAHLVPPPPEIARGDAAIATCLGELRTATAARSVPLLVVLLPDWIEVDPARLAADVALLDAPAVDPGAPARRLTALVESAGIELLDLTPTFAAAVARREPVYFPVDRHFTPLGHRLAAAAIAERLRAQSAR